MGTKRRTRGDAELMLLALAEAAKARGRTRPNPMVGCVVADGAEVIAVGHHARAGEAHAEVVALRRAGRKARGADVYVTLEPCDHHGRTGPCTEVLVAAGVRRVFVGTKDPNPLVDGRGIRRLVQAGLEVEVGLCEAECQALNEAYATWINFRRPLVVAKLAESLDGRVATRIGEARWISSPEARELGHRLRDELDGILVGRGTVTADDPQLTCRVSGGRDPVRIVLDTEARTPPSAKVVRQGKSSSAPTWIFVSPDAAVRRRRALERAGAETVTCRLRRGRLDPAAVLAELGRRELCSLLVEGGPTVLGSFFDAGLVDRVHATLAPMIIGGQQAFSSVGALGVAELRHATRLTDLVIGRAGSDILVQARVVR